MANDILLLAKHLQWHKFHLVGQSMGGLIAQRAASMICLERRYNLQLESLTLFNTFAHIWTWEGLGNLQCSPFIIKCALSCSKQQLVHTVMDQMYSAAWLAKQEPNTLRQFRHVCYDKMRDMFTKQQQSNIGTFKQICGIFSYKANESELATLRKHVRILLIGAGNDSMVYSGNTKRLHKLYNQHGETPLVWFQDAGHIVNVEERDAVNRLLFEDWFLK